MKNRGRRADEFIRVLKAIWTTDPVEFHGEFFNVPRANIFPKPVQKPHPPVYLAAFSPSGLKRVATMANGWLPHGASPDVLKRIMTRINGMAYEAGRGPDKLELVVRANIAVTDEPLSAPRLMCTGSPEQVKVDIAAIRDVGVDELHFDPSFSPDGTSLDGFLKTMVQMKQLADVA